MRRTGAGTCASCKAGGRRDRACHHDPNAGGGEPAVGALTVQFRVQFLDVAAAVIQEMHIDAHSVAGAIELVAGLEWPPGVARMLFLGGVGVGVPSNWQKALKARN